MSAIGAVDRSGPARPRPAIVLDCDPGHDDVFAILAAATYGELLGITTVAGNGPLNRTTANALTVCQLFDLDVSVHPGAERPLAAAPFHPSAIHGASGLDGPLLPPLARAPASIPAAEFLLGETRRRPGGWIVATGPLTNVAHAVRIDPTLPERVAGVAIMGGGVAFGNWTPVAEFNIWADPEAAEVVFGCGVPLRMVGLDVSHQVLVGDEHVGHLRAAGDAASQFLADVLSFFARAYQDVFFDEALGPLHDPCAVLAVTHPHLFEWVDRHVAIETQGRHTRGMTVVDQRGVHGGEPANVAVAMGVDAPGVLGVIFEAVERCVVRRPR